MKKGASRHQRPRRRKSEMLKSGQGRAGRSEGMSGYGVESCNNLHVVLLVLTSGSVHPNVLMIVFPWYVFGRLAHGATSRKTPRQRYGNSQHRHARVHLGTSGSAPSQKHHVALHVALRLS
eukprot:6030175-Pyramimonas_sp.AAC.1